MADVELQELRREYSRERTPENLARLLKAVKRSGEDWNSLFENEACSLFTASIPKVFKELHPAIQDFVRYETEVFMYLNSEFKKNNVDEILGECRFPRVNANSLKYRSLDCIRKYKETIKELKVRTARTMGDPFVRSLCQSGLPVSELNLSNSKVTDNGLEVIASSSLPLKGLYLCRVGNVTSKFIKYLERSNLPLEKLDVRNTGINWIAIEDYKQVKTDVEVFYA